MAEIAVEVRDEVGEADGELLLNGLLEGNAPHLGPADFRPLAVLAHEGHALVGGLTGETGRGVLYIDRFWVVSVRGGPPSAEFGLGPSWAAWIGTMVKCPLRAWWTPSKRVASGGSGRTR